MPGGEARQERDTSQRVPGNDRLKSYVPEEALGEARRRYDFPMGSPAHIGLKDWKIFSELMVQKMFAWNASHPENVITKENVTLDHVKPKSQFMHMDDMTDCQHFTNLQPLPRNVHEQKGDRWSFADEQYWRAHVFRNPQYKEVYLPRGLILR